MVLLGGGPLDDCAVLRVFQFVSAVFQLFAPPIGIGHLDPAGRALIARGRVARGLPGPARTVRSPAIIIPASAPAAVCVLVGIISAPAAPMSTTVVLTSIIAAAAATCVVIAWTIVATPTTSAVVVARSVVAASAAATTIVVSAATMATIIVTASATTTTVVVTGNHYWIDGLIGTLISVGPAMVMHHWRPISALPRRARAWLDAHGQGLAPFARKEAARQLPT